MGPGGDAEAKEQTTTQKSRRKGDEEAEMGLISDIHDNLRKVEALKLNYSTKTLVD